MQRHRHPLLPDKAREHSPLTVQSTTVRLRNTVRDGQANARATHLAAAHIFDTIERLEECFKSCAAMPGPV